MHLFRPVSKLFSLAVLMAGVALAEPAVDFGLVAPTGGSVSYAGGSSALVGTGIQVDNVVGINGTPLNNNVLRNCIMCTLSFTTGGFAGSSALGPTTQYSFFGGGSFTISGTVDLDNNGVLSAADATGTLLSGVFDGITSIVSHTQMGSFAFGGLLSTFGAVMNNTLAGFYGVQSASGYYGYINLSFFASPLGANGAFNSTSLGSGDVIAATPEPVSIILLGTTLVLCGTVWRRRLAGRS